MSMGDQMQNSGPRPQRARRAIRPRTAAALSAIALLTSGCLFATDMDVTISRDGSGSAVLVLQYDDDIARLIGPAAQFEREVLDAQAEGANVEIIPTSELEPPYTQGLRYSADFADVAGLRAVLLDGPFDTATVRLDGRTLTIDAAFEGDGDSADSGGFGADLLPTATARVTLEIDGTVISSDATSSSGSTHTWRYNLTESGQLQLTAELASGPSTVTLVLIGLAALVVVGAGAGAVKARSRRSRSAAATGPEPHVSGPSSPGNDPAADDEAGAGPR
jgi:hypothetical protein